MKYIPPVTNGIRKIIKTSNIENSGKKIIADVDDDDDDDNNNNDDDHWK